MESQLHQDYSCAICLCLLTQPVTTPCKHNFCRVCLLYIKDTATLKNSVCPMCRSSLKDLDPSLKVNLEFQNNIQKAFPQEYQKREQEIQQMIKNTHKLVLKYGNKVQMVDSANNSDNKYQWTMQLLLDSAEFNAHPKQASIQDYVQKVTFKLHPTFNPPSVSVEQAPFKLRRIGWGTFTVGIEVVFKKKYGGQTAKFDHYLNFDEDDFQKSAIDVQENQK